MHASNGEFSRFLLDLYSISNRVGVGEFRPEVFKLLDRLLKFDSAWWGTGLLKKPHFVVAQASLYKLEPDFLTEYAKLANDDPLAELVDAAQGDTVAWSGGGVSGSAEMNRFDVKHGLYFGLTCMPKDPVSGVGMFISVFRGKNGPEFDEAERLLMQSVMGHLVLAWSINLRLALASESSAYFGDACLVDADGGIIELSHVFADKLHFEFPDWSGNVLPVKLLRSFIHEKKDSYRGKSVIFRNTKSPGGQIRLHCGPIRSSALTPREESVALEFAKGSSYKEIASSLNLSPGTVRSYLTKCYSKLNVKNKIELGNALGKDIGASH